MQPPAGPALTEEFRQQERERGRRSFYYFYSAICGFTADDPDTGEPTICDFHQDLAAFLEGSGRHYPYTRAVVCASRGTGKSVEVMVYEFWRAIYITNFSVLVISNSAENAKKLHFLPLIDLIKYSPRSDYLRWLYYDRIPADFGDTNSEQLDLVRTDPLAPPAITYAGMDSKLEGKHPDLIVCHKEGTPVFIDGKWMQVEDHPSAKRFKAQGIDVSIWGMPHAETVSLNHRYWCVRIPSVSGKHRKIEISSPAWVEARNLTNRNWIGLPINYDINRINEEVDIWEVGGVAENGVIDGRFLPGHVGGRWKKVIPEEFLDPEWWWFFGLWWGDGTLSGDYQVAVCVSDHQVMTRLASLLDRYNISWSLTDKPGMYVLTFCRAWMNRWLKTWKRGNSMKMPPAWMESVDHKLQKALVDGYIAADGYTTEKETRITSIYLPGLNFTRRVLARMGIVSTIRLGPPGGVAVFPGGKTAVGKRRYDLRISTKNDRYDVYQTFIRDGYLWSKIRNTVGSGESMFVPVKSSSGDYDTYFGRSHNCDDPEGADAEKSTSANDAALALWDRVRFLVKYPLRSQIILVATPWGRKPLVWALRDKYNWQEEADNATCEVKFFWRPIEDANGNSVWPARFPKEVIDSLRRDKLAKSQCWLERDTGSFSLFDMDAITRASYTWLHGEKMEVSYRGFRFNPDEIGDDGYIRPQEINAVAGLREMRFYIHMDPLHKTSDIRKTAAHKARPATAAIGVVGVAPDWHAFLVDYWVGDAPIDVQANELFRLYRAWCPVKVTYEAIGAQIWLKTLVETQEGQDPNWSRPKSSGRLGLPVSLPRLSRRLESADKQNESKDWLYRERLSPWLNQGVLHINMTQGEVLKQLAGVLNESVACDLADCLAQGPTVWQPGQRDLEGREYEERRAFVQSFVRERMGGTAGRTGFQPPGWSGKYRVIRGGG